MSYAVGVSNVSDDRQFPIQKHKLAPGYVTETGTHSAKTECYSD